MKYFRRILFAAFLASLPFSACEHIGECPERTSEMHFLRFRIAGAKTRLTWTSNLIPVDNDMGYPYLKKFAAVVSSDEDEVTYRTFGSVCEEADVNLESYEEWDSDCYSIGIDGNPIGGTYALRILANCDECENFASWTGWNGKIGLRGGVERYSEYPSVPMYGATYVSIGFDSESEEGTYTEVSLYRLMACVYIDRVDVAIPGASGAVLKRCFISNAPDYTYVDNPLDVYRDQISLGRGHCLHNSVGGSLIGGYTGRSDWGRLPTDGERTADYSEIYEDNIWPLYVFPTDNTYSDLIFTVMYQGREFYYRAAIPSLESNTIYRLKRVRITTPGNPDPDFPETIALSSQISVIPWSPMADYSENF